MLRPNTQETAFRLRHWWRWGLGLMAVCAVGASVARLNAAADGQPPLKQPAASDRPRMDLDGHPLPTGTLARLGTLRWRHGAPVNYLAFTPDGKAVLTASQDGVVRLWERQTGKEIRRFANKDGRNPVVVEPRGLRVGGWIGPGMGQMHVALTPDGKTLVTAAMNTNNLHWWDVATGKAIRTTQVPFGLGGLTFSPDGKYLAGRASDQAIHLWEASTGNQVRQIRRMMNMPGGVVFVGGINGAASLAFSHDSKLVATAESTFANGQITTAIVLWEVETGKEARRINAGMGGTANALAFAPDGKTLAYADNTGIHLCSAETGKEVRPIGQQQFGTFDLVFAPDGKTLAAKSYAMPEPRLYSVETGKILRTLGAGPVAGRFNQAVFFGGGVRGREMAFSPDSKVLATAEGNAVRFWTVDTGKDAAQARGHYGDILATAVTADGQMVASLGADGTVRLWDLATGKERHQFTTPAGTACGAFAPDARTVALGLNNGVVLVDTETGKERHRLQGHLNGAAAVAFSPDGKVVASRGNGEDGLRLYDAATGKELRTIGSPPPKNNGGGVVQVFTVMGGPSRIGLVFSPDGKLVATPRVSASNLAGQFAGGMGMQITLNFCDVATGKEVQKIVLPNRDGLMSFAFSPDGRTVAMENADGTIALWEVASGKERSRFGKAGAPGGQVPMQFMVRGGGGVAFGGATLAASSPTLAFAPNGRTLASRGLDKSVYWWDIATGKELGRLKGHEGTVTALAFARDGKMLISGSSDTTLLVWDATHLTPPERPKAAQLQAAEVDSIWTALAGPDAAKAYQGMQKLRTDPGHAVAFLRKHLQPAIPADPQKVRQYLADLDSKRFILRQRATRELERLGELAVPALEKALKSGPPLEQRRRIEQLLEKLTGLTLSNEQLRLVRAVEVLEQLGTPAARQLLETLSRGAAGALPTREAKGALDRLAQWTSAQR